MALPDWLATAVLQCSGAAGKVASALVLASTPYVSPGGEQRRKAARSVTQLIKDTGLSKPSIIAALRELQDNGYIERLNSIRWNAPSAYDMAGESTVALPTAATAIDALEAELATIGVSDPHRLVSRYGYDQVLSRLTRLQSFDPARVTNPAGLLVTMLRASPQRYAARPQPGDSGDKFFVGKYGRILAARADVTNEGEP